MQPPNGGPTYRVAEKKPQRGACQHSEKPANLKLPATADAE